MTENSKIEWTTHTFNPWRGCTKIAPGCANCYADSQAKRNSKTLGIWGEQGTRVVASEAMWREPVKWNAAAKAAGERHRVFCASMADVFENWGGRPVFSPIRDGDELLNPVAWYGPVKTKDGIGEAICHAGQMLGYGAGSNFRVMFEKYRPATLNDVRARLFALIDATPHLDWLLLTKRPENVPAMWPDYFPGGYIAEAGSMNQTGPRPNVWLGCSIANQADADRNIPLLLQCRELAPVLFLSAEPLLGPVDLDLDRYESPGFYEYRKNLIDWLICGGESGPNARPMHPDWARSLRDQCQGAGVPFFFKQWGEFAPCPPMHILADQSICVGGGTSCGYHCDQINGHVDCGNAMMLRLGKKKAGRLLDGREWSEFPAMEATA